MAGLAERIQRQLWQDLDHRYFSGVEVIREISRRRGVPAGSFAGIVFASAREQGRDQAFQQGDVGANWLGRTVCAVSQTPQVLLDHQVYEDRGALSYKWDAVEAMFPPRVVDEMVAAYGGVRRAGAGGGGARAGGRGAGGAGGAGGGGRGGGGGGAGAGGGGGGGAAPRAPGAAPPAGAGAGRPAPRRPPPCGGGAARRPE